MKLDAVITFSADSYNFALKWRDTLWPNTPVIFTVKDLRSQKEFPSYVTGIHMPIDYAATVQAALRLQPETRHLVVLCGSASAERFNLDYAMKQITPLIGNLDVIHITGLPLPELEDRLAGLPKQSITDYEEAGYEGGALTLRILNGEQPSSISPQITKSAHFVYDWRQLQKWGIDESRLPAAAGYCTDLHHSGKNTNGESAERSHC